jgi:phosphoribosylformylglycinamidine synthase subunit PurL
LPIGATNCLNFGNPERPEIMWQLAEAVAGIGEACRALDVPITGGNVSLYNETEGSGILPTPVIGVVGVLEDASKVLTRAFPSSGLDVILFGENPGELGGSEYLKTVHGLIRGLPPVIDLTRERALHLLLVQLAQTGAIRSAHDCAEGGFAIALAECCFDAPGIGADVNIERAASNGGIDLVAATLFGESASRVIVSARPDQTAAVLAAAHAAGVPAKAIGRTGGFAIRVSIARELVLDGSVSQAEARWRSSLSNWLDGQAA